MGALTDAHEEQMRPGPYVQVADMAETDRLWNTLRRWWPAIEVLLITCVTNAKTEAANTSIKNVKRTARGFRNENHCTAPYPSPQVRPKRSMNTHHC